MANFLNKLGDMAKTAADKTGEMVEITKLNSKISTEQAKITGYQAQIGGYFYENMRDGANVPAELLGLCDQITAGQENILGLQKEIAALKGEALEAPAPGKTKCPSCGAEIEPNLKFCGECGAKL